jgi:hypothetical protein
MSESTITTESVETYVDPDFTEDQELESTTKTDLEGEVNPYGAHKLVNAWLADRGVDKEIPPQMMYNYTRGQIRKGRKPMIKYDEATNSIQVTDLAEWFEKYVTKFSPKA